MFRKKKTKDPVISYPKVESVNDVCYIFNLFDLKQQTVIPVHFYTGNTRKMIHVNIETTATMLREICAEKFNAFFIKKYPVAEMYDVFVYVDHAPSSLLF